MKKRLLVTATCLTALAACNSDKGNASANAAGGGNSANASATQSGGQTDVETLVAQQAARVQPRLPLQQGPITITAVEAKGTELITSMTLPMDLTEATAQAFRTQVPTQQCAVPEVRDLIRRGARYSYRLTDSGGEVFNIEATSCP